MDPTNASKPKYTWRALSPTDIPNLIHLAQTIHKDLPERDAVFAEKIALFPSGCLGLFLQNNNSQEEEEEEEEFSGYIISHPIRKGRPPALDSFLGEIASDADQYFIHDIAILPGCRGEGAARMGVERVLKVGEGYETTALVSVYGTSMFWGQFGFVERVGDDVLAEKVRGYGGDAVYLERENNVSQVDR
ncbi:hypothetical protein NX059_012512 [Plenodomus lindquistii]|nr:hypothetical protein NX059_012512 [Plenodomus lindquistii]